jgi:MFS family permease
MNQESALPQKATLWTKDFILVCFIGLATGVCMRMLDSNLASFASVTWSSKTLGGYLTSVFNVGAIAMAFFTGRLVDIKGRRNCLVFGTILFSLSTFMIAIWPVPALGLAARFIQGIGKGIVSVASAAIVSDVVPKERMNEGMGFFNLGNTISFAFGPMLGLALAGWGGYVLMFIVCAVCYLVGGAIGIGINYEKKPGYQSPQVAEQANLSPVEYKGIWKMIEKKSILYSLNNTIFFAGYACVLVFITVYAQEHLLLSSTEIGLFYTVAAGTMFLVRVLCNKLADIYGALCMIVPGHIFVMLMLLVLAFFAQGNYPMFLVAGGLYGLGNAAVMPAMNAATVVDAPAGRTGAANATFFFMMDFGVLFASAFFGALIDAASDLTAGYLQMFLISLGICVLSLLMALALFNKKARERRRAS